MSKGFPSVYFYCHMLDRSVFPCVEFSLAYFSCSHTLCHLYGCMEQNISAIPHSVSQKYRHLTVIYRVPNIYQALM